MSGLTTHVLDTALGRPAAGLRIELVRLESGGERLLASAVTNDDGRCDAPLIDAGALTAGDYELRFQAGDYLARHHPGQAGRPFLDQVPIRFRVSEPDQHYHVPLLLSPFGYSTYRGS